MVKICAIGDPHGDLKKIKKASKDVDFYLVTGDLGKCDLARKMYFENIKREKKGLSKVESGLKINKKIHDEVHFSTLGVLKILAKRAPAYSIQGNVEITTIKQAKKRTQKEGFRNLATRKIIDESKNMYLVKNVIRNIDGIRIGFLEYFIDTSWVREFKPSDYKKVMSGAKRESDKAREILERFAKVDILVCHQPPYGYLDKVSSKYGAPKNWWGKHAGSKIILDYIKKFQPRYVFCGHIHEGEGHVRIGKSEVFNLGVGGFEVLEL